VTSARRRGRRARRRSCPATARSWGVRNVHDPREALDGRGEAHGPVPARLSRRLVEGADGVQRGPGRGRPSLPAETRNYIHTILGGSAATRACRRPCRGGGAVRAAGRCSASPDRLQLGQKTTFDQAGFDRGAQGRDPRPADREPPRHRQPAVQDGAAVDDDADRRSSRACADVEDRAGRGVVEARPAAEAARSTAACRRCCRARSRRSRAKVRTCGAAATAPSPAKRVAGRLLRLRVADPRRLAARVRASSPTSADPAAASR
jgi:hypothetical protein